MDIKDAIGQLNEIVELTTNGDHRTSAHLFIKLIDGKLPYSDDRLIEFINEAQEFIIK